MLEDESLVPVIRAAFRNETREIYASEGGFLSVRKRIARRRLARRSAVGASIASALAIGLVFGATGSDTHQDGAFETIHLSNYTLRVAPNVATSTSCLADPRSLTAEYGVGAVPSPIIVVLSVGPRRGKGPLQLCVGAVMTYTTQAPVATRSVIKAGSPTVYLAAQTKSVNVAYIALDAAGSTVAARTTGGPVGVPYYVIGEMPATNSPEVLVALFQQGIMAAALNVHDQGY